MITEKRQKNKGIIFIILMLILIGSGLFAYTVFMKNGNLKAQTTANNVENLSSDKPLNLTPKIEEEYKPQEQDEESNIVKNNKNFDTVITNSNQSSHAIPAVNAKTESDETGKTVDENNSIFELLNRPDRDKLFNPPIPFSKKVLGYNKSVGKVVALTFDDGPSKEFTKKYVDILKSMDVKATFFVIGKNAEKLPDLLKYILENGNEIGIHSYSHSFMPKMKPEQMIDELYKTQKIIVDATDSKSSIFRPPYGAFNETLLKISNALGLHVVLWNVDPDDWKNPGIQNIVDRIVSHAKDGSIILMHEGKPETLAALPQIIEKLKSEGYSFFTVSELFNYKKGTIENSNESEKSNLQQQPNTVFNSN